MAVSVNDITTRLQKIAPKGYTVTTTPFTDWITHAINKTIATAGVVFRERTYVDCIGDGITTRYALPGFDSALVPVNMWPYPHTTGTFGGIAEPTTGPTLALHTGGSTIPSGATIYVGFSWANAAGTAETQRSPLTSIVTTAANQTVDVTLPASKIGVTKANIFSTIDILNPQHTGRVATGTTVSSTATTTATSLGLGSSTVATWPLIDYVLPSDVSITEDSGFPRVEWNEDVTGRVPSDLTAAGTQSVIMLDTAMTSGQRLRAYYTRAAQLPAASTSAILGVPDDAMMWGCEAELWHTLALNHEDSAQDKYWQSYIDADQKFLAILATQSGRPSNGAKIMQWSSQTV